MFPAAQQVDVEDLLSLRMIGAGWNLAWRRQSCAEHLVARGGERRGIRCSEGRGSGAGHYCVE